MPAHRKNEQAEAMFGFYLDGYSLSQIATIFGVTRQAVYKMLKRRRWKLRTVLPLPFITFQGARYSLDPVGYYRKTDDDRHRLHTDIWEHFNGPSPIDFHIHHRNGNKQNNKIQNLQLVTRSEHGEIHGFAGRRLRGFSKDSE